MFAMRRPPQSLKLKLKLNIRDEGYSYLDARFLTILADSERKRLVRTFSAFSHGMATH